MLNLWVWRETLPDGRTALRVAGRPAGAPPPAPDAELVESDLALDEYQSVAEEVAAESDIPVETIRPSLETFAEMHAAAKPTKKKRMADLRRWKYDAEGADGAEYRRLYHEAVARKTDGEIAEFAAGTAIGGKAQEVVLFNPPTEAAFEAARAAGLIELSRRAYRRRLEATEKRLREAGIRVVRLEATAGEVLAVMRRHDLLQTPEGRATAYGLLHAERKIEEDA